jgi:hypothetical protein
MVKFTYLNPFSIPTLLLMSSHILFRTMVDKNGDHFIVPFAPFNPPLDMGVTYWVRMIGDPS